MGYRKALRALTDVIGITESWPLPDLDKLQSSSEDTVEGCKAPIEMEELASTLSNFGIYAKVSDYYLGSSITTFILDLPSGFRLSKITKFEEDLARELKVSSIRVNPNCKGKVGIEIENARRIPVGYKELAKTIPPELTIPVVLGEDTLGNPQYMDIADLPHLLVAGSSGSGKSVFLHSLICSILATRTHEQVQLRLVDPKKVTMTLYKGIPHLYNSIAKTTQETIELLEDTAVLMRERTGLMEDLGVENLSEYREETGKELPYIVVIIDEYANLLTLGSRKDKQQLQEKVIAIANEGRAAGIHLVITTQNPLATVVTSEIKANLQARVAFSVPTMTNSKVILDEPGAERLIGKGDMLFKDPKGGITRIQTPMISKKDIRYITGGR